MFYRLLTALFITIVSLGSAFAAGKTYDAATFNALIKAGKPVVVQVSAPWCPYCKKQNEILSTLEKDPRFQAVNLIDVDFDTHEEFLKTWHVPIQSTILVIKGGKVIAQTSFDIHADSIEAMMLKAI